jgi:uncharacterized damage-inducible protein DinB
MNELALPAKDILAWVDVTAGNWKKLEEEHPEIFTLPCDIAGAKTTGELIQHIVAVELRYAERLSGLPETAYEQIPVGSANELLATHERAMEIFRSLLANGDYDWSEEMEFNTRSMGKLCSSRRTIFFHALLHGIRHYAQLATLVRQHGIKPEWPMDYLAMDARRA